MKLKFEELKDINRAYLIVSSIPAALFTYAFIMYHTPIIYYMVWVLPMYGALGLMDLAWYIDIYRKCRRLANSSLYECDSECYYQHCKEVYCDADAYSSCIDMCKQIFNNTG